MGHHTRSLPVLVDNSFNRAMSIKYALLSAFALSSAITTGFGSVTQNFGQGISVITTIVMFLSCAVASLGAWNSTKGIRWEKTELFSVITFVSFLLIWSGSAVWLAVLGDTNPIGGIFLSLMLCVLPVWRVRYFYRKNRIPK